jgi:hypothetical protein
MMPRRTPSCDGTDCEPGTYGWSHSADCLTWQTADDISPEDLAATTAMEDGYRPIRIPAQTNRRAAA